MIYDRTARKLLLAGIGILAVYTIVSSCGDGQKKNSVDIRSIDPVSVQTCPESSDYCLRGNDGNFYRVIEVELFEYRR